MKISIDKHILIKPLEQAAKFLPSKNVIPILAEFLLKQNMTDYTSPWKRNSVSTIKN